MKTIAVVGAGFMGPGIAQVFAAGGHSVRLYGRTEEKFDLARERIRANIGLMADYELAQKSDIDSVLSRISMTTNLERACGDATLVLETIVEDLSIKQDLFAKLDRICEPATILSSNTSVLSITEIASKSIHKERIIGTHFYQPPHLVPLVEVTRTQASLDGHVDEVFRLLAECGKTPVRVLKDIPGFIANRMQHALWREAFALIDEGVCDAETIDVAVSNSFGMRLPVLGPVANADLVGLDLTNSIHTYILPKLNVSTTPASTLRDHLSLGELGFKTRKGFREWTDESMTATKDQLSTFLLEVLRLRNCWAKNHSGS
jgi:3-hydroxybutyryl-CoA dehydrogenase